MTVGEGAAAPMRVPSRLFRMSPRLRNLLILAAITVLSGLGQTLFRDIIALLRQSRHLLNEDLGVATQASFVAYIVMLPAGGFLAHLFGPRRVLLPAGVLIAVAGCGMGFVFDARSYAGLCLLLGLAAGTVPGAAATAIGFLFAPQEHARAIGCLQAAPVLGSLAVTLAISDRAQHWSGWGIDDYWRVLVLAFGLLAAAWTYQAYKWYGARPVPAGSARADRWSVDLPVGTLWPLGVVLRGGVLLLFAYAQAYGLGLGGAWLAERLFATWHLDIDFSGFVGLCGLAGGMMGSLAGGFLSDAAFQHSGNVRSARQVVIGAGFLLGGCCLLPLQHTHDVFHAGLWRGISFFCFSLPGAPLWAIALTIAPGKPGPVAGMLGLGSGLGLLVSPAILAGYLGDWGWTLCFWMGVVFAFVCGVAAFFLDPALEIEKPLPKPSPEGEEE